jgi:hypothetical protein
LKIAQRFKNVSGIPFENCAGAIDGILIWIEKPTEKEAKKAEIGRKNYYALERTSLGCIVRLWLTRGAGSWTF